MAGDLQPLWSCGAPLAAESPGEVWGLQSDCLLLPSVTDFLVLITAYRERE